MIETRYLTKGASALSLTRSLASTWLHCKLLRFGRDQPITEGIPSLSTPPPPPPPPTAWVSTCVFCFVFLWGGGGGGGGGGGRGTSMVPVLYVQTTVACLKSPATLTHPPSPPPHTHPLTHPHPPCLRIPCQCEKVGWNKLLQLDQQQSQHQYA
jgi:hypothetical protein